MIGCHLDGLAFLLYFGLFCDYGRRLEEIGGDWRRWVERCGKMWKVFEADYLGK